MNTTSKTERIAILGAAGQLGQSLREVLQDQAIPFTRAELDITDADDIPTVLKDIQANIIINCAAYNQVDRAEEEPEQSFAVNAFAPYRLAKFCAAENIPLVQISTDYVFGDPGDEKTPLNTGDVPQPNSVYSMSKLAGEKFVETYQPQHFIIRTCGLYGPTPEKGRGNFVQTMLRLATSHEEVRVVNDQTCTPTSTVDLAAAICRLIETDQWGTYHITNSGQTNWAAFAKEIFRLADLPTKVVPISSEEFGAAANRPGFSVLDCQRFESATGFKMPEWQDGLARYLAMRQ